MRILYKTHNDPPSIIAKFSSGPPLFSKKNRPGPPHDFSPPPPHINSVRSLNAFTFGSQLFFFISYFFWTVPLVSFLYSNVELLACIASVSVWFRSKERPSTPFFARSLTLVPRSLLLNRTETLATQAIELYNSHTLFLTAHSFFAYEALLGGGGVGISLVWISNTVVLHFEELAMSLSVFNPFLCCLTPFHLFYVAVSRPCCSSEFYPNRALIILFTSSLMLAPLLLWSIYSLPIGESGTKQEKNFQKSQLIILMSSRYWVSTTNFSIMW